VFGRTEVCEGLRTACAQRPRNRCPARRTRAFWSNGFCLRWENVLIRKTRHAREGLCTIITVETQNNRVMHIVTYTDEESVQPCGPLGHLRPASASWPPRPPRWPAPRLRPRPAPAPAPLPPELHRNNGKAAPGGPGTCSSSSSSSPLHRAAPLSIRSSEHRGGRRRRAGPPHVVAPTFV